MTVRVVAETVKVDTDHIPDSAKRPGVFDTTTDVDFPTRKRIELDNIEPW